MENEKMYDEEFIITLTIEGTQYEEVEVEVTDPMKTIREQINSIVEVFHLPKMDNGGRIGWKYADMTLTWDGLPQNMVDVLVGMSGECTLEFDDAEGREQTLTDYNVQPGDRLHLISRAIAG